MTGPFVLVFELPRAWDGQRRLRRCSVVLLEASDVGDVI
jgi:hypothetical protein